jgi:hypothetical protein
VPYPKLSYEYVKSYFEKQGCELLEKNYFSNKSPLKYRCKCNKVMVTCWNNFSRGFRCRLCYLNKFSESRKKRLQMLKMREKLYTLSEVARMYDANPTEFWNAVYVKKQIFAPMKQVGDRPRRYYTEKDIKAIGKLLEKNDLR